MRTVFQLSLDSCQTLGLSHFSVSVGQNATNIKKLGQFHLPQRPFKRSQVVKAEHFTVLLYARVKEVLEMLIPVAGYFVFHGEGTKMAVIQCKCNCKSVTTNDV